LTVAVATFVVSQHSLIDTVVITGLQMSGPISFMGTLPNDYPDFSTRATHAATLLRTEVSGVNWLGQPFFRFTFQLDNPFLALGGMEYQISAPGRWEAISGGGDPSFTRECGAALNDIFTCSVTRPTGVVFALQGTAVPEPSTLLLLGLGLAAAVGNTARLRGN
jgi:hypothetical protein